ncbi:MAG: 30S ribosomal protein S16 [Minisyncoccota bacterium]
MLKPRYVSDTITDGLTFYYFFVTLMAMLKIRLQRVGRKHEPTFRVVLTDSKNSTKSGRLKEILGSYDPRKTVDLLKTDRIKYWLGLGALPTGTVHNLFVNHKIIDAKKINVLPKKTPPAKEAPAEEAPVPEAPNAEASTPEAPAADKAEPVVESTEAKA